MDGLEQAFRSLAEFIALGIELCVIVAVAVGAIEAITLSLRHLILDRASPLNRREIWVRFAGWILLSLEFALGADIIRTAIAPSWEQIGKLAAIAGIRTVLNFFLGRDVKEALELRNVRRA